MQICLFLILFTPLYVSLSYLYITFLFVSSNSSYAFLKMGYGSNTLLFFCQRLTYITISCLFLLILGSIQVKFKAEGRANPKDMSFSQIVKKEEKVMMTRAQIGSRPPRCERRCSSCGHCEAIQVPTNPQVNHGKGNYTSTATFFNIAYSRGDGTSNYKPMSWKCKCGNSIFNP